VRSRWVSICAALLFALSAGRLGAQNLPPIAVSDPPFLDFSALQSPRQLSVQISTTRTNASFALTKVSIVPPQGTDVTQPQLSANQLTPANPVILATSINPITPVRSIGAHITVTLKNVGPPFPDLPTNSNFQLVIPVLGTEICDPAQATCNLSGPYCTIDKNSEDHVFVAVDHFESITWPAVRQHLAIHNNAFNTYQTPLRFLIDSLGLTRYLTKDTTACPPCPAGCCQCANNCAPLIQFTKPANRSPQATFTWTDTKPAEFDGVISNTNFTIRVPSQISGFTTVGPSHSELFFNEEHPPRISLTDSNGKVILDQKISCLNVSTFESVVRSPFASSDFPHVNLRFGQP
jgi:hypothetical protein